MASGLPRDSPGTSVGRTGRLLSEEMVARIIETSRHRDSRVIEAGEHLTLVINSEITAKRDSPPPSIGVPQCPRTWPGRRRMRRPDPRRPRNEPPLLRCLLDTSPGPPTPSGSTAAGRKPPTCPARSGSTSHPRASKAHNLNTQPQAPDVSKRLTGSAPPKGPSRSHLRATKSTSWSYAPVGPGPPGTGWSPSTREVSYGATCVE